MTGTTLILIRHGHTAWNAEKRMVGQADIPLTVLGRQQALDLARDLSDRRLDAIVSSDLIRCRQTAAIVVERSGVPINTDPGLREIDEGDWTGLHETEIEYRWPELWRERWARARPSGEHPRQALDRALGVLRRIAEGGAGRTVGIVTHQGIARLVRWASSGRPWEDLPTIPGLSNCAYLELIAQPDSEHGLILRSAEDE